MLAAIEVLDEILNRRRPAAQALNDWGRGHRFAGARDRAAIGNIVFDGLRKRHSLAAKMGNGAPRAIVLGVMAHLWRVPPERVAQICAGGRTPEPLSAAERTALTQHLAADAPDWVRGDYPEWLGDEFQAAFGDDAAWQGVALAERAPIDLRVNTLKADRAKVLKALQPHSAAETPLSPLGVRVPARAGAAKAPNLEVEAAHGKGWFEVQDEGSQIAALLTGAEPGMQAADVCAGAGGKTLALAAAMGNTGQLYAYDSDKVRLRPIFERLKRAGVRNAQVLPAGDDAGLAALRARMDVVLVDAPCSGSGAWRRRPDAKWRLSPQALEKRHAEQRATFALAAPLVRPGGKLVYVTCSVLPSENEAQVARFLDETPGFSPCSAELAWAKHLGYTCPASVGGGQSGYAVQLTPASHGTDGFFVAILERIG